MITRGFQSSHGIGAIYPRISITMQATVFIAMFAVLGILSIGAATQSSFDGDLYVTRSVQALPSAVWPWVMETASYIGNGPILVTGAVTLLARFLYRRQTPECLLVVAGTLSTPLAMALKVLIGRERPSAETVNVWKQLSDLSFPSGHAFTSVIAFGLLCYLAPRLTSHWTSDVVGGVLFGGLTLGVIIAAHSWWSRRGEATEGS